MTSENLNAQCAELGSLASMCRHDITNLTNGTKRAATDARKRLSQISKLCTAMRVECLLVQKSIPKKTRCKKKDVVVDVEPEPDSATSSDTDVVQPVVVMPQKKKRGRKKRV